MAKLSFSLRNNLINVVLGWLQKKLIHYLIWSFISMVETNGNNNVSIFDIEDDIGTSLTS
jgi:hypothetical protein